MLKNGFMQQYLVVCYGEFRNEEKKGEKFDFFQAGIWSPDFEQNFDKD